MKKIKKYLHIVLAHAKHQKEKILLRYPAFSPHEQYAMIGGAVIAGLLLFYITIGSLLMAHIDTLRKTVQQERKTFAWMKKANQQIQSLKNESISSIAPLPFNLLQEKIKESPFKAHLTTLEQMHANEIHCVFNKVRFDDFIRWLIDLSQKQHFTLKQISVHGTSAPGIVKAELVLII